MKEKKLSDQAVSYLRVLDGESIPMSWNEASVAILELKECGLAYSNGHMVLLTEEGRAHVLETKQQKGSVK